MDSKQNTRNDRTYDLAKLKSEIDLPALVSQFIDVKRAGNCYKALCPFHPDKNTPSLAIYKNSVYCFGCGYQGDAISFIEDYLNLGFRDAVEWLGEHIGHMPMRSRELEGSKHTNPNIPIPDMVIEYWHKMLTDRTYYYERLFTDTTIDFFRLGWDGTGYIIPTWESRPGISGVFSYKKRWPNPEPGQAKYTGPRGRSQPRLFNQWALRESATAFVFIGEFDAILAYQDGLSSVSPTCGQQSWQPHWNSFFQHKRVYVVPDVGESTSGYRIASAIGSNAKVCEYPPNVGGDYTDFRKGGYTVDDFFRLVVKEECKKFLQVEPYWEAAYV